MDKEHTESWQNVNSDALLSYISDVVGIIDSKGIVRYKSPNITALFGWKPEELIGKPAWENVHPDDFDRVRAIFEQFWQTHNTEGKLKFRYRSKDRTYSLIELTATNLIDNPNINGILINYHDVTELQEAEEKLRRSEERFKALHNASFGGIAIHDKGMILDCNKGLVDKSGYSMDELIGMNGLELIAEDCREFVMKKIIAGYDKPYQTTGLRKNGEEYPLRLEGRNVPYRDSQVRVVEFRDITDTKRVELEIQQKNQELATTLERIKKINSELEKAKERAEESDRLKTAFLSNLSHEIRTPMNGILGFADLLSSEDLEAEDQQSYVSIIQQSGERMLSLINDLIDISHIETGQIKISKKEVNINQLLTRVFAFFKPLAEQSGLEFTLEKGLQEKDSFLLTDPTRVEQVLTNLLGNAIKFTKQGEISFGYKQTQNQLRFWIKDTGRGIPPDMTEAVFERFRQVDDSTYREEEGSGLGLAISKSIVELLGGEIGVISEIGSGSEFYFTLPMDLLANPSLGIQPQPKKDGLDELKILIAEDDDISFLFLKNLFSGEKFEVVRAHNGKEAVESFQRHTDTDVVLMDLKMPIMNGLEATRRIRALDNQIPIIAQTAYVSDQDREKAKEAGCNETVSKPIKKELLMSALTRSLANRNR